MSKDIVRNEEGASAVEYGLLVAGIAALIAVIVFALGGTVNASLTDVNDCVAGNGAAAAC